MVEHIKQPVYLHVIPWDITHPGGVSEVVRNLLVETSKAGEYTPCLLVSEWDEKCHIEHVEESPWAVLKSRLRPVPSLKIYSPIVIFKWIKFINEWLRLARLLRRIDVTHIALHYVGKEYYGFLLLKRLRIINAKVLPVFHGTDLRNITMADDKKHVQKILSPASSIIVVSKSQETYINDNLPSLSGKVKVIYNGVNKLDADILGKGEKAGNRFTILSVGSFDENKGHVGLLEAFSMISKKHKEWELVLIGRTGPLVGFINEMIRKLGLSDKVSVYENVPHCDIGNYFSNSDLFVLNSRSEAFGLVLLEAGIYGLPVIATKVGGIPELISNNHLGILVPSDDAIALSNAICTLIGDRNLRSILGHNLQQLVSKEYSWRNSYRKYTEIQ